MSYIYIYIYIYNDISGLRVKMTQGHTEFSKLFVLSAYDLSLTPLFSDKVVTSSEHKHVDWMKLSAVLSFRGQAEYA